ncbi:MAG: RraA family protein [Alphaproteobacteria bacterium]|nr:RraA family protein [Alphaproteobacteria bacterium]
MFVVNPLPKQVDADLIALLEKAEPATIGHFLEFGFVDPEVRAHLPDKRVAGTAVTCRFAGVDNTIVHYALGQIRPGDFLVIDRVGDRRHACVGGAVVFQARAAGAKGIVVDGPATDIGEIRAYGLPVWSRGLSTITGKRLFTQGEFCVPVQIGGAVVEPGDAILADENGVLVLKVPEAAAAAKRAIEMQAEEAAMLKRVAAGERMAEINGTNRRVAEILAAQAAKR